MSTTRVERGKANPINQPFTIDGFPTDADGPVTVTVTRDDGTVLALNAPTTKPTATTGVYQYILPAQTNLDRLTFVYTGTWSGTVQTETQHVEIVGDFFFTLNEARAADASFTSATYSDDEIRTVRAAVEDAIEGACGVAFVERYARHTLHGLGTRSVFLPNLGVNAIRSISVNGVAASSTIVNAATWDAAYLYSDNLFFTRGHRNVVVAYEHGLSSPPPLVKRAALLLFKAWLPAFKASGSDPSLLGVRSISVEGYSVSYGRDGVPSYTGVAAVDELLHLHLKGQAVGSVMIG